MMTNKPRPYDPNDPPRVGEWVWVGGLGQTPAIDRSKGQRRIRIAVVVVVALVAWFIAAFRGCHREPLPTSARLIFGSESLGADGSLRGRLEIELPEGEFIDTGVNGTKLADKVVLIGKIGDSEVKVVPPNIKYTVKDREIKANDRVLLGGKVGLNVTIRDAATHLPGEVTISYEVSLVDQRGRKTRDISGSDSVRFGD